MSNEANTAPTARLNFGNKIAVETADQTTVAEETVETVEQAEEAQQEASTDEVVETETVEAEAETETSENAPVDASEAPVETSEQTIEASEAAGAAAEAEEIDNDVKEVGIEKSVEELQAEREKIEAEIKSKQDAQKVVVLDQIKTVAANYGVTLEDIVEAFGGLKLKRKGSPAKAKYVDPVTKTTWSGRGREPLWIRGKDRAPFLIND